MSEHKKNKEMIISLSNKPSKPVDDNVATGQTENVKMILLTVLLLMAIIMNHYVFCKIQGKEEDFWNLVEEFNRFCEKNSELFIKGSISFFMFAVGVSLVQKSISYNQAKQSKKLVCQLPK